MKWPLIFVHLVQAFAQFDSIQPYVPPYLASAFSGIPVVAASEYSGASPICVLANAATTISCFNYFGLIQAPIPQLGGQDSTFAMGLPGGSCAATAFLSVQFHKVLYGVLNDGSVYYSVINSGPMMQMPDLATGGTPFTPLRVTSTVLVPGWRTGPFASVSILPQPDATNMTLTTCAVQFDGDAVCWQMPLQQGSIARAPFDTGGGAWRDGTALRLPAIDICNPTAGGVCIIRGRAPFEARSITWLPVPASGKSPWASTVAGNNTVHAGLFGNAPTTNTTLGMCLRGGFDKQWTCYGGFANQLRTFTTSGTGFTEDGVIPMTRTSLRSFNTLAFTTRFPSYTASQSYTYTDGQGANITVYSAWSESAAQISVLAADGTTGYCETQSRSNKATAFTSASCNGTPFASMGRIYALDDGHFCGISSTSIQCRFLLPFLNAPPYSTTDKPQFPTALPTGVSYRFQSSNSLRPLQITGSNVTFCVIRSEEIYVRPDCVVSSRTNGLLTTLVAADLSPAIPTVQMRVLHLAAARLTDTFCFIAQGNGNVTGDAYDLAKSIVDTSTNNYVTRTVRCFGVQTPAQLDVGYGTTSVPPLAYPLLVSSSAQHSLAAGSSSFCAYVSSPLRLDCFPSAARAQPPIDYTIGSTPSIIGMGENFTCVVVTTTINCTAGTGTTSPMTAAWAWATGAPFSLSPTGSWRQLAVATTFACFQSTTGATSCFGSGNDALAAMQDAESQGLLASKVSATGRYGWTLRSPLASVAAGPSVVCVTNSTSLEISCFGAVASMSAISRRNITVSSVSLGVAHACAILSGSSSVTSLMTGANTTWALSNNVLCWGDDDNTGRTNGIAAYNETFQSVAVGPTSSCGVTLLPAPGFIRCWGSIAADPRYNARITHPNSYFLPSAGVNGSMPLQRTLFVNDTQANFTMCNTSGVCSTLSDAVLASRGFYSRIIVGMDCNSTAFAVPPTLGGLTIVGMCTSGVCPTVTFTTADSFSTFVRISADWTAITNVNFAVDGPTSSCATAFNVTARFLQPWSGLKFSGFICTSAILAITGAALSMPNKTLVTDTPNVAMTGLIFSASNAPTGFLVRVLRMPLVTFDGFTVLPDPSAGSQGPLVRIQDAAAARLASLTVTGSLQCNGLEPGVISQFVNVEKVNATQWAVNASIQSTCGPGAAIHWRSGSDYAAASIIVQSIVLQNVSASGTVSSANPAGAIASFQMPPFKPFAISIDGLSVHSTACLDCSGGVVGIVGGVVQTTVWNVNLNTTFSGMHGGYWFQSSFAPAVPSPSNSHNVVTLNSATALGMGGAFYIDDSSRAMELFLNTMTIGATTSGDAGGFVWARGKTCSISTVQIPGNCTSLSNGAAFAYFSSLNGTGTYSSWNAITVGNVVSTGPTETGGVVSLDGAATVALNAFTASRITVNPATRGGFIYARASSTVYITSINLLTSLSTTKDGAFAYLEEHRLQFQLSTCSRAVAVMTTGTGGLLYLSGATGSAPSVSVAGCSVSLRADRGGALAHISTAGSIVFDFQYGPTFSVPMTYSAEGGAVLRCHNIQGGVTVILATISRMEVDPRATLAGGVWRFVNVSGVVQMGPYVAVSNVWAPSSGAAFYCENCNGFRLSSPGSGMNNITGRGDGPAIYITGIINTYPQSLIFPDNMMSIGSTSTGRGGAVYLAGQPMASCTSGTPPTVAISTTISSPAPALAGGCWYLQDAGSVTFSSSTCSGANTVPGASVGLGGGGGVAAYGATMLTINPGNTFSGITGSGNGSLIHMGLAGNCTQLLSPSVGTVTNAGYGSLVYIQGGGAITVSGLNFVSPAPAQAGSLVNIVGARGVTLNNIQCRSCRTIGGPAGVAYLQDIGDFGVSISNLLMVNVSGSGTGAVHVAGVVGGVSILGMPCASCAVSQLATSSMHSIFQFINVNGIVAIQQSGVTTCQGSTSASASGFAFQSIGGLTLQSAYVSTSYDQSTSQNCRGLVLAGATGNVSVANFTGNNLWADSSGTGMAISGVVANVTIASALFTNLTSTVSRGNGSVLFIASVGGNVALAWINASGVVANNPFYGAYAFSNIAGDVTVSSCPVRSPPVAMFGAAFAIINVKSAVLTGCPVSNAAATGGGAAIYADTITRVPGLRINSSPMSALNSSRGACAIQGSRLLAAMLWNSPIDSCDGGSAALTFQQANVVCQSSAVSNVISRLSEGAVVSAASASYLIWTLCPVTNATSMLGSGAALWASNISAVSWSGSAVTNVTAAYGSAVMAWSGVQTSALIANSPMAVLTVSGGSMFGPAVCINGSQTADINIADSPIRNLTASGTSSAGGFVAIDTARHVSISASPGIGWAPVAAVGGGFSLSNIFGNVAIHASPVTGTSSLTNGGAFAIGFSAAPLDNVNVSITSSPCANTTAAQQGGAVWLSSPTSHLFTVTIQASAMVSTSAGTYGAGVYVYGLSGSDSMFKLHTSSITNATAGRDSAVWLVASGSDVQILSSPMKDVRVMGSTGAGAINALNGTSQGAFTCINSSITNVFGPAGGVSYGVFAFQTLLSAQLTNCPIQNVPISQFAGAALYYKTVPATTTLQVVRSGVMNTASNGNGAAYMCSGTCGSVLVQDSVFQNLTAMGQAQGGTLYFSDATDVTITGCSFTNSSSGTGGTTAIYNVSGPVTMTSSSISRSSSVGAGGTAIIAGVGGLITLSSVTIRQSMAGGQGGSVVADKAPSVTASDVLMDGSSSGGHGGGIVITNIPTITLSNVSCATSTARLYGGCVAAFLPLTGNPTLRLSYAGGSISNVLSARGGAVAVAVGALTDIGLPASYAVALDFINLTIWNGVSATDGGAISIDHYPSFGSLTTTVVRCSITNTLASAGRGGAFYHSLEGAILADAKVAVRDSSFIRTISQLDGGGAWITIADSTLALPAIDLSNVVFNGTVAISGSGGALAYYTHRAQAINVIADGCQAVVGGAFALTGSSLDLRQVVLRNNVASRGSGGAIQAAGCLLRGVTVSYQPIDLPSGAPENASLLSLGAAFLHNKASEKGGAVFLQSCAATFNSSVFVNNSAGSQGGAIQADFPSIVAPLRMYSAVFCANAALTGGAVSASSSSGTLRFGQPGLWGAVTAVSYQWWVAKALAVCTYQGGLSSNARTVAQTVALGQQLNISGLRQPNNGSSLVFIGNRASTGSGGDINIVNSVNFAAELVLTNAFASGSSAGQRGGSMALTGTSARLFNVTVHNSTVQAVFAAGQDPTEYGGGGLSFIEAPVIDLQSVVVGNCAAPGAFGGAIYLRRLLSAPDGPLAAFATETDAITLTNCTLSSNAAGAGGQLFIDGFGSLPQDLLNNTLIVGGSASAYGALFASSARTARILPSAYLTVYNDTVNGITVDPCFVVTGAFAVETPLMYIALVDAFGNSITSDSTSNCRIDAYVNGTRMLIPLGYDNVYTAQSGVATVFPFMLSTTPGVLSRAVVACTSKAGRVLPSLQVPLATKQVITIFAPETLAASPIYVLPSVPTAPIPIPIPIKVGVYDGGAAVTSVNSSCSISVVEATQADGSVGFASVIGATSGTTSNGGYAEFYPSIQSSPDVSVRFVGSCSWRSVGQLITSQSAVIRTYPLKALWLMGPIATCPNNTCIQGAGRPVLIPRPGRPGEYTVTLNNSKPGIYLAIDRSLTHHDVNAGIALPEALPSSNDKTVLQALLPNPMAVVAVNTTRSLEIIIDTTVTCSLSVKGLYTQLANRTYDPNAALVGTLAAETSDVGVARFTAVGVRSIGQGSWTVLNAACTWITGTVLTTTEMHVPAQELRLQWIAQLSSVVLSSSRSTIVPIEPTPALRLLKVLNNGTAVNLGPCTVPDVCARPCSLVASPLTSSVLGGITALSQPVSNDSSVAVSFTSVGLSAPLGSSSTITVSCSWIDNTEVSLQSEPLVAAPLAVTWKEQPPDLVLPSNPATPTNWKRQPRLGLLYDRFNNGSWTPLISPYLGPIKCELTVGQVVKSPQALESAISTQLLGSTAVFSDASTGIVSYNGLSSQGPFGQNLTLMATCTYVSGEQFSQSSTWITHAAVSAAFHPNRPDTYILYSTRGSDVIVQLRFAANFNTTAVPSWVDSREDWESAGYDNKNNLGDLTCSLGVNAIMANGMATSALIVGQTQVDADTSGQSKFSGQTYLPNEQPAAIANGTDTFLLLRFACQIRGLSTSALRLVHNATLQRLSAGWLIPPPDNYLPSTDADFRPLYRNSTLDRRYPTAALLNHTGQPLQEAGIDCFVTLVGTSFDPLTNSAGSGSAALLHTARVSATNGIATFVDLGFSSSLGALLTLQLECSRPSGGYVLPTRSYILVNRYAVTAMSPMPSYVLAREVIPLDIQVMQSSPDPFNNWQVPSDQLPTPVVDMSCTISGTPLQGIVNLYSAMVLSARTDATGSIKFLVDVTGTPGARISVMVACGVQGGAVARIRDAWIITVEDVDLRFTIGFPRVWIPSSNTARTAIDPAPQLHLHRLSSGDRISVAGVACKVSITLFNESLSTTENPAQVLAAPPTGFQASVGSANVAFEVPIVLYPVYFDAPYGAGFYSVVSCTRPLDGNSYVRNFTMRMVDARPAWLYHPPPKAVANANVLGQGNASIAIALYDQAVALLQGPITNSEELPCDYGICGLSGLDNVTVCTTRILSSDPLFVVRPTTFPVAANGIVTLDSFSVVAPVGATVDGIVECRIGSRFQGALHWSVGILPCPMGQAPAADGISCMVCTPNGTVSTYSDGGVSPCIRCPSTGVKCDGGVLQFLPSFYRADTLMTVNENAELHQCTERPYACEVPAVDSIQLLRAFNETHRCAQGYRGVMCSVCDAENDYAKAGAKCIKCWPKGLNLFIVSLVPILLLTLAIWISVFRKQTTTGDFTILQRILIANVSATGTIGSLYVNKGTHLYRSLLGLADAVGDSVLQVAPIQCTLRTSYYERFALTILLPVLVAISAIIINVVRITFFEAREFIKNIRFARDTSGLHHSYVLPRPSVDLVRSSKAKVGDGDGGHKDKGGCCSRCCRRNDARRALSTMKDGGVRHKSVVRQIINPAFLGPGQRKPAAEQPREGVRRHVTLRNVVVPEPVAQTPTLPSGPAPRVHRPRPSLRFGDVSSPETTLAAWSFSQGFRHSCTRSNVLLRNWFQSRAWFAPLVYVLNLGYSSITTTSFGVFKCTGFPIASKYYLTLDYNVQCYTPNHIIAMTCAVIVILLAVVGIPAFFASKIYHHRHELDREIVVQRYGFLKGRSTWVAGRANLPGDGYRQASCPLGGLQEMFVYDG